MNRQVCTREIHEQWRINLIALWKRTGMSAKQIAEKEDLCEKSVSRVFSGESKNPGADLVRKIIHALGGTWNEIFAESGAVIGDKDLAALQAEVGRLTEENATLRTEIAMLRMKLEHKEEIIALHNYYNKLKPEGKQ